ncbi:MAG: 50S ribosomal protein L9 [Myxococcales bacterium]|nr:50S ribosomal protein L9 [Myxococcales bacterium]
MKVILREDVQHLGAIGDVVNVSAGYGRNYLLPRGLAVLASDRNVGQLQHAQRVIADREKRLMRNAEVIKQKVEGLSLSIAKQVGEEEKLFGSVTAREIAEALAKQGFEIDRKKIKLDEPIRTLGMHPVPVQLARGVDAELKVWVVAADAA